VSERASGEVNASLQLDKSALTGRTDERLNVLNPEGNPNHSPCQHFAFKHGVNRWPTGTEGVFGVTSTGIDLQCRNTVFNPPGKYLFCPIGIDRLRHV
jgi:hypothetical protein